MLVFVFWTLVSAVAVGYSTLIAGWWATPVFAAIAAAASPKGSRPLVTVPLGCVVGWGALLLRDARAQEFESLLGMLSQVLSRPEPTILWASLALAALLGLGSALLGLAFSRRG